MRASGLQITTAQVKAVRCMPAQSCRALFLHTPVYSFFHVTLCEQLLSARPGDMKMEKHYGGTRSSLRETGDAE